MKVPAETIYLKDDNSPTMLPDSTSGCSTPADSSSLAETSESSDDEQESTSIKVGNHSVNNKIVTTAKNSEMVNQIDILQHISNTSSSGQTLGNVFIERSNGVHIGNITYITGPIHVVQTANNESNDAKPSNDDRKKSSENTKKSNLNTKPSSEAKEPISCDTKSTKKEKSGRSRRETKRSEPVLKKEEDSEEEVERVESNTNDAFIGNINRAIDGNVLRIVNRMMWLAQRPLEPYNHLSEPAQYVIISHTASEEAYTQAENVFLVRHVQCFHIESCRWNDIAYNFLVGCDGNVYEGRGWRVEGAHTYGYNKKSVGISFVGCFMRDRPPDISLKACKLLIKRGVELGHIQPDYQLLGHCQCSATESPGRALFEEIQRWSHFTADPKSIQEV